MTKYSPELETFIQQRFPATAPSREAKDKKLFAAYRQDIRGTPKGTKEVKKLPEDLAKKIQKTNLDILAAFKNSAAAHGKKVQTPQQKKSGIPSAMLKAMKKPGPDGTPLVKNKSFRADRLADYAKNNFFLKKNYFHTNDKAVDTVNKNSSSIKNKTSDAVLRHMNRVTTNSSDVGVTKGGVSVSSEMINEDEAGNLNIEDIIFVEKRLNSIALIMEQDFEIYDQIKEYVDIVQEESFTEFFACLKSPKIRQVIKNSMILERWAMFFIFFFYFNQEQAAGIMPQLRELIQLIHRNVLTYLKMFAYWISPYEHLEVARI